MLYCIPDYYKEFICTADRCEATCCVGWQIAIDKKSLGRYKKQPGEFGKRLRRSVNWRRGTFRQTREKRCVFLNKDNLCDLYPALGADSLCRTCSRYPRHVEEFENVRELTLSLSCPTVAQILLRREAKVAFRSYEKEGTEKYEGFDRLLYEKLCDAREAMRGILQNRNRKIEYRMTLVLGLAHDIQVRIKRGKLEDCDRVIARYLNSPAAEMIQHKMAQDKNLQVEEAQAKKAWNSGYRHRYFKMKQLFIGLHELESVQDDWDVGLRETEQILFGKGLPEYESYHLAFAGWIKNHMPKWDIQCEQLLVYFMDTYFCGAVYDGRAYSKMQMAVGSVCLIYELLLARWVKNGRELDQEDIVRAAYQYSREIEHSDRNLELLERQMRVISPGINPS